MTSIVVDILIAVFSIIFVHVYGDNTFNTNYFSHWGSDHFALVDQGNEAQIRFDINSGAGFRSRQTFNSGLFRMRIKIPEQSTKGIVTGFYLNSANYGQDDKIHDEIDIEFIGTTGILLTNVFSNDLGHREQQFRLWFDPSKDFHTYQILWSRNQIVFFVDNIPIRVFKNNWKVGVIVPNHPMRIEVSMWNAPWAGQVDWSKAPFISHFREFSITACPSEYGSTCKDSKFFWNTGSNWELSPTQNRILLAYKKKYMVYDYCTNYLNEHPECSINL